MMFDQGSDQSEQKKPQLFRNRNLPLDGPHTPQIKAGVNAKLGQRMKLKTPLASSYRSAILIG